MCLGIFWTFSNVHLVYVFFPLLILHCTDWISKHMRLPNWRQWCQLCLPPTFISKILLEHNIASHYMLSMVSSTKEGEGNSYRRSCTTQKNLGKPQRKFENLCCIVSLEMRLCENSKAAVCFFNHFGYISSLSSLNGIVPFVF